MQAAKQPTRRELLERAVEIGRELDRRDAQQRFHHFFPDETHEWRGEKFFARKLYTQQMEFFGASAEFREVCMMAANRVGKTIAGGYAVSAHLTGEYPGWWPGKRFTKPIRAWAAGDTNETTRDIVQKELLGPVVITGSRRSVSGTGMIPGDRLGMIRWKAGMADLCDVIRVRHISGGWSTLGFKSYQQGRISFQGTEQEVIWLDEEPDRAIYSECLTRTATTGGLVMSTFTPLEGLSEVALMFLPQEYQPDAA